MSSTTQPKSKLPTKPIESLAKGDTVQSFDHLTAKNVFSKVSNTFRSQVKRLARVAAGGAIFLTTLSHPFFANGQYTPAQNLHRGDSILTQTAQQVAIENITIFDTLATVYNIEVENTNNYFVGQQGLLVHNSCTLQTLKSQLEANSWRSFLETLVKEGVDVTRRINLYKKIVGFNNTATAKAFVQDFNSVDASIRQMLTTDNGIAFWLKIYTDANKNKELLAYLFLYNRAPTSGFLGQISAVKNTARVLEKLEQAAYQNYTIANIGNLDKDLLVKTLNGTSQKAQLLSDLANANTIEDFAKVIVNIKANQLLTELEGFTGLTAIFDKNLLVLGTTEKAPRF